uniref:Putative secreted protein n=1 Tax=Ixodes ricinus TaxID=34613 RepID=A0A6B0TWX2_IXORI
MCILMSGLMLPCETLAHHRRTWYRIHTCQLSAKRQSTETQSRMISEILASTSSWLSKVPSIVPTDQWFQLNSGKHEE